jgi:hypothetical protein
MLSYWSRTPENGWFVSFIFICLYSLCRGDSLCQFPIALHCTLARSPQPSPSTTPSSATESNCKMFHHYISFMYKSPIKHSPSFSSSFMLPLPQIPPDCTYFTVLSFIFNSKISAQTGFLMYPHCWVYFSQFTPLCYSPLSLLSYSPLFK